jgi:hypothetical protein
MSSRTFKKFLFCLLLLSADWNGDTMAGIQADILVHEGKPSIKDSGATGQKEIIPEDHGKWQ